MANNRNNSSRGKSVEAQQGKFVVTDSLRTEIEQSNLTPELKAILIAMLDEIRG